MDPFVSLKIGDETKKSTVKDNAGDAGVWEESLTFLLSSKEDQVNCVVKVMNHNLIKDDQIGKVVIQVVDLVRGVNKKWFQLTLDDKLSGELCLSSKFRPALHLEVNECKNLRSVQLIGKQDPYVKMCMRGGRATEQFEVRHNTVVNEDGGKNPKWTKSDFFFHLPPENKDYAESEKARLDVEVLDSNVVKDTSIGTVSIPYEKLRNPTNGPVGFELTHNNKPAGEIFFTVLEYNGNV